MYEIEKGIPVPRYKTRPQTYPLLDMGVGDSFFAKVDKPHNLRAAVQKANKDGRKYTVRTVEGGLRVWRIA